MNSDMILNTLFSSPIRVKVEAEWHEATYQESLAGKKDEIIRPEFEGKVVGVVNRHAAQIPHYVVVDESGMFHVLEQHKIVALDYSYI